MGAGLKIGEKSSGSYISTNWNGYTFVEWNTAPDDSGTGYAHRQKNVIFTEDTTLYAQWDRKCKIIYKGNGGNFGRGTDDKVITEKTVTFTLPFQQTGDITFNVSPLPTKEGQVFTGWSLTNDNQNASPTIAIDDLALSSGMFTATVYAVWEDDTYIASYDPNLPIGVTNSNITPGDVNLTYSDIADGYTVQPTAPAAEGCQFVRWNYYYYQNTALDGNRFQRIAAPTCGICVRNGKKAQEGRIAKYPSIMSSVFSTEKPKNIR